MINSLVTLDKATQMLAEVETIDDAKDLIDLAEAARVYARQIDLGLKAQNHAAEIKLRAQRRAGEILSKMEKNKGTRNQLQGSERLEFINSSGAYIVEAPENQSPTLKEIGINYRDASYWQSIASLPDYIFEDYISTSKDKGQEITTAGVIREANKHKHDKDLQVSKEYKIPLTSSEKNRLYGRFATGIIIQAIKAAAGEVVEFDDDWKPDGEYEECTPVEYLTHETTKEYCRMGGVNYELIKSWVEMGCPTYRLHDWLCETIRKQSDENLMKGRDYD